MIRHQTFQLNKRQRYDICKFKKLNDQRFLRLPVSNRKTILNDIESEHRTYDAQRTT